DPLPEEPGLGAVVLDVEVPVVAWLDRLADGLLPNGNTVEQTIGKAVQPGDDWHFDIQHIGAQTRFLRQRITDRNLVVAYLENELKSWPAWRRAHGDAGIPTILDAVRQRFPGPRTRVVLSGHSGGGS